MQPWEANDIDQTFKQAAEKVNFPYESGNWKTLDGRLSAIRAKGLLLKGIVASSLISLVAIVGYLSYYDTPASFEKQFSQTRSNPSTKTDEAHSIDVSPLAQEAYSEATNELESNSDIEKQPNNQIGNKETIKELSPTAYEAINALSTPVISNKSKEYIVSDSFATDQASNPIRSIEAQSDTKRLFEGLYPQEARLPGSTYNDNSNVVMEALEQENVVSEYSEPQMKRSRWSIGLSIAPDYSGVSFKGNKAGFGLGVTASYYLSNRLSISSGVFYAKKDYDLVESRYGGYNSLWNQIQRPNQIEASCNVIEIPINFRLDMISTNKNKVFMSTGLSTYFMAEENYIFTYNFEGPSALPGMNLRGENKHLFSIYNLSIGFQRRLSDRFGIEIEPYIKVPVGGVGVWDVNLTSSGSFVTARYFFK